MVITHKLKMDLEGKGGKEWIEVSQWDACTQHIRFLLYSGQLPWAVPSDAEVLIRYQKPDGRKGVYDTLPDGTSAWTAEDNELTISLVPQALTAAGSVMLQVAILQQEKRIHTFALEVVVRPVVGSEAAGEESENYFSLNGILPGPEKAEAGQFIRVSDVDSLGNVIRVEAVDAPTGGIADAEQVQRIVEEYLEENPPAAGKGTVTSVNGVSPDEKGNVQIEVGSGGDVDLTGYATEQYVQGYAQPKGNYLTEVPAGYAKTEDIPTKPGDIGAQPEGDYALRSEIPTDAHITGLINTALGVIENGTY